MENVEIFVHIHSDFNTGDWKVEIEGDKGKEEFLGVDHSSAIDISAATVALSYLYEHYKGRKIKIYTESEYLKKGITNRIENWRKNGWKTKENKPVKNKEQWENLYALYDPDCIQWI